MSIKIYFKIILSLFIFFSVTFGFEAVFAQNKNSESEKDKSQSSAAAPLKVLQVENDVIAVQVSTDVRYNLPMRERVREKGLFNIGTAKDHKTLVYEFPDEPYSSHINVKIDDQIYSNDSCRTGTRRLPMVADPAILDNTITCAWQVDQVTIEQRLTPEQYSDSTGGIFIQYILTNQDSVAHQIGLLLLLDTMINGNDAAAVATNFGYSDNEQEFLAPNIPDYFQAFETNPVTPGLIAQGTLRGGKAVPPDVFVVGYFPDLVKVAWDYTLSGGLYEDSAILLRWNAQPLASGEQRIIGTYFGIGEVTIAPGQLSLNVSAPSELQYVHSQLDPNPFSIYLTVTNTGFAPATDVLATLHLPPELNLPAYESATKGLYPAKNNTILPDSSRLVSWQVLARMPQEDITLTFKIDVTSTNSDSNGIVRQLFIPAPFSLEVLPESQPVMVGETGSYQIHIHPAPGYVDIIALSAEGVPENADPGFSANPLNLQISQTLTFTITTAITAIPGHYPIKITATAGEFSRQQTVLLELKPRPGFSLTITPDSQIVTVGQMAQFNLAIDSVAGLTDPILLTAFGLPDARTFQFDPNPIDWRVGHQSTLTIYTNTLTPGSYPITITASANGFSRSVTVTLVVLPPPYFLLMVEPATQTVTAGQAAQFQVTIDSIAGLTDPILLTAFGLPGDSTFRFDPNPIDWRVGHQSTLTIYTDTFIPGSYPITITASANGFSRSITVTLVIVQSPDFRLLVEPDSVTVTAGQFVQVQVSMDTLNGFDETVKLNQATLPKEMTARFQPNVIQGAEVATLTVQTEPGLPGGRYQVFIHGQSATLTRSARLVLMVRGHSRKVFPDPFTPNGDGYNDFVLFNYPEIASSNGVITIFTIRGKQVMELIGQNRWSGTDDQGHDLPGGVYLYIIKINGEIQANGTVTLIR